MEEPGPAEKQRIDTEVDAGDELVDAASSASAGSGEDGIDEVAFYKTQSADSSSRRLSGCRWLQVTAHS